MREITDELMAQCRDRLTNLAANEVGSKTDQGRTLRWATADASSMSRPRAAARRQHNASYARRATTLSGTPNAAAASATDLRRQYSSTSTRRSSGLNPSNACRTTPAGRRFPGQRPGRFSRVMIDAFDACATTGADTSVIKSPTRRG